MVSTSHIYHLRYHRYGWMDGWMDRKKIGRWMNERVEVVISVIHGSNQKSEFLIII